MAPAGVVGVAVVVGPAVVLGLALLTVGLGAAELLEGAGAGGPKQPVRTIRLLTPKTVSAGTLGLDMMPPRKWTSGCGRHFQATPEGYRRNRALSPRAAGARSGR